jgi:hypothetical protein
LRIKDKINSSIIILNYHSSIIDANDFVLFFNSNSDSGSGLIILGQKKAFGKFIPKAFFKDNSGIRF